MSVEPTGLLYDFKFPMILLNYYVCQSVGPGDYSSIGQLVTFSPRQTTVSIPVGAIADGIVELPEYYTASASLFSADANVMVHPDITFINVADNDSKSCLNSQ